MTMQTPDEFRWPIPQYLELEFDLRGKTLPADHGYRLYAAIKQILQQQETPMPPEVLLCSIAGISDRGGIIYLNRFSRFRLRFPAEQVRSWYHLQNQVLDIQGHLIRLVQPRLNLPQPSRDLKARLVTFKLDGVDHRDFPHHFLTSCKKALTRLDIHGEPEIDSNEYGDLARRVITIRQKKVVGYGVKITQLTANESIKLQCFGLGGRKHFGCGWFYGPQEFGHGA